ncbi:hypothetical protein BDZ91DRAFT_765474 [Kalaharituber pfeilii]|nr:hypothetical protein BDZ91DRAFT_765474 [Kalaharituber pfeilii]
MHGRIVERRKMEKKERQQKSKDDDGAWGGGDKAGATPDGGGREGGKEGGGEGRSARDKDKVDARVWELYMHFGAVHRSGEGGPLSKMRRPSFAGKRPPFHHGSALTTAADSGTPIRDGATQHRSGIKRDHADAGVANHRPRAPAQDRPRAIDGSVDDIEKAV